MRRLLTALPALALLAGCGTFFAELEIPSTTVTLKGQTFPGTPVGVALVKEVTFDLGKDLTIINEKGVTFELRLIQMKVDLTTTSAMGDFGNIRSVTLSVLPPTGQTLPEEAVIASYVKPPPPAIQNPNSIAVAAMANLDLAPYITSGQLRLRFSADSVIGAIPDWTADVGAEFYLKVHVDYLKTLTKK
jgi:hypothetical protein